MTDHVRVRPPGTVFCEECGWSYTWALPVSISIFVAGNRVVEEQHQDCAIYRQDWRRRLLRLLDERLGRLEAEEMLADWEEAKRRGEMGAERRPPHLYDFVGDPVDRCVAEVDAETRTFWTAKLGVEGCPVVLEGNQGMWFRAVAAAIEDGWTERDITERSSR